jgi:hypothetical protein
MQSGFIMVSRSYTFIFASVHYCTTLFERSTDFVTGNKTSCLLESFCVNIEAGLSDLNAFGLDCATARKR